MFDMDAEKVTDVPTNLKNKNVTPNNANKSKNKLIDIN